MRERTPEHVLPLFAREPDPPPKKDDAPRRGSNGASVNGRNSHPDPTRLPPTPPARHNAPAGTSEVAAALIDGSAKDLRARVLAFIIERGQHGATDDEGEAALGIKPQTYTPRRGELAKLGLVADSGERRPTASGRPAAVWVPARLAPKPEGGAA